MTKKIMNQGIFLISAFMLYVLSVSGMIYAQNAPPQPGKTIDKNNYSQYKEFFPEFFHEAFTTGWELVGPLKISIQEKTSNPVPAPFLEATAKNKGKYSLDSEGYITGGEYKDIVGFPFPDPDPADKDFAIKFMWNFDYRYKLDDSYGMFINFEKRKGEQVVKSVVES